jgi:hypothetical protein
MELYKQSKYLSDSHDEGLARLAFDFRVRAAWLDHTVRVALFPPGPTSQGSGIGNSGTSPTLRAEIRGLRSAALKTRGNFDKHIQEGVSGLQRGPKAKLPRPTNSIFRDYCHLPTMFRPTGGYAQS